MSDGRGDRDPRHDDGVEDPSDWLAAQFAGDDDETGSNPGARRVDPPEPDTDVTGAAGEGDDERQTVALPVVPPPSETAGEVPLRPAGTGPASAAAPAPAPASAAAPAGADTDTDTDTDTVVDVADDEAGTSRPTPSLPTFVPPPAADPPRAEGHPQALDLAALRAAADQARPALAADDTVGSTDGAPDPVVASAPSPEPGAFTALITPPADAVPSAEPVAFDWDRVRSVAGVDVTGQVPVTRTVPDETAATVDAPRAAGAASDATSGDERAGTGPDEVAPPGTGPTVARDQSGRGETGPHETGPDETGLDGAGLDGAGLDGAGRGETGPDATAPDGSVLAGEARAGTDAGESGPSEAEPSETEPSEAAETTGAGDGGHLARADQEPEGETVAEEPIVDGPAPAAGTGADPWWVTEHREMTRRERRLAEAAGLPVPPAVPPGAPTGPTGPTSAPTGASVAGGHDAAATPSGSADGRPRDLADDAPGVADAPASWSLSETGDVPLLPEEPDDGPVVASTGPERAGDDATTAPGRPAEPGPPAEPAPAASSLPAGWPFATPGGVDPSSDAPAVGVRDERPTFTEILGVVPAPAAAPADAAPEAEPPTDEPAPHPVVDPVRAAPPEEPPLGGAAAGDPDAVDDDDAVDDPDAVDDDDAVDDTDVAPAPGGGHAGAGPVDPPTAVLAAPVAAAPASANPGPGAVGEPLGLVPTGAVPAPVGRPRSTTPPADALPGVTASGAGPADGAGRASGAPRDGDGGGWSGVEAWARRRPVLLAVGAAVVLVLALVALFFLSRGIASAAESEGAAPVVAAEPLPRVTRTVTAEPVAPVETAVPAGPLPAGTHSWQALQGGECLASFVDAWQQEYDVVDCASPHAAQLTALVQLEGDATSAWPGLEALQAEVLVRCSAEGALDRAAAGAYTGVQLSASYPATAEDWAAGDRRYACFVSREAGQPLTSSLAPAAG